MRSYVGSYIANEDRYSLLFSPFKGRQGPSVVALNIPRFLSKDKAFHSSSKLQTKVKSISARKDIATDLDADALGSESSDVCKKGDKVSKVISYVTSTIAPPRLLTNFVKGNRRTNSAGAQRGARRGVRSKTQAAFLVCGV